MIFIHPYIGSEKIQKKYPKQVANQLGYVIGFLQVGKGRRKTIKGNTKWTTCAVINVDQSL
jgi:hypothetical protein